MGLAEIHRGEADATAKDLLSGRRHGPERNGRLMCWSVSGVSLNQLSWQ